MDTQQQSHDTSKRVGKHFDLWATMGSKVEQGGKVGGAGADALRALVTHFIGVKDAWNVYKTCAFG